MSIVDQEVEFLYLQIIRYYNSVISNLLYSSIFMVFDASHVLHLSSNVFN
jgi:hypothetical protein